MGSALLGVEAALKRAVPAGDGVASGWDRLLLFLVKPDVALPNVWALAVGLVGLALGRLVEALGASMERGVSEGLPGGVAGLC